MFVSRSRPVECGEVYKMVFTEFYDDGELARVLAHMDSHCDGSRFNKT